MKAFSTGNIKLEVQLGLHPGWKWISKFGAHAAVPTGGYEIWSGAAAGYAGWLQAAQNIRIKAGGDAADTAAGAGAQAIRISGLNSTWDEASEDIATNGATVSSNSAATYVRINRIYIPDSGVGTYGVANTGAVVIESAGSSAIMGRIEVGLGQSQIALYTIPDGYKGLLHQLALNVGGNQSADVYFFQRRNADDASTPFSPKRLIRFAGDLAGNLIIPFGFSWEFPARTDLWVYAESTAATTPVDATFELLLVPA